MPLLHDPAVHQSLDTRVRALRPDSQRLWGRMTVDQMLWHVNESFRLALGDVEFQRMNVPRLPKALLKWIVLYVPWPRGRAPTYDEMRAREAHDFGVEQQRLLELVDRMASRSLDGAWPGNPTLGRMSGREWNHLQAKHLDHHLRQFGV
jgi:hypothetical protein